MTEDKSQAKKIELNQKTIELSHLDKAFYPEQGYRKEDILKYYQRIADRMLPYLKGRPLVMQRFPDGIGKEGFYQKQIPDYFPSWIKQKKVNLHQEGSQDLVVVHKKADLIYLVNQGTLVFHVWLSTANDLNHPDKIIFDLDPPEQGDFGLVKFAARKLKNVFGQKNLATFVMTTGSKGLHVVLPVKPDHDFDRVRAFAREKAQQLADQYPHKLTIQMSKEKRENRIFLDYLRNSFGQTAVAPYSLRAIEDAPVATPIDWSELASLDNAQKYNFSNIFRRLGQKKDPWGHFSKKKATLSL